MRVRSGLLVLAASLGLTPRAAGACCGQWHPPEIERLMVVRAGGGAAGLSWEPDADAGCATYDVLGSDALPAFGPLVTGLGSPQHVDSTATTVSPLRCYLVRAVSPAGAGPSGRDHSWDASWEPVAADFPVAGILDNEYFDGHPDDVGQPTPVLPPGAWDWTDANNDLANWRNFSNGVGTFSPLRDENGQYGWKLEPRNPAACDFTGGAMYFEGSPGIDLLDLGPQGTISSFGSGNLGDGPDVLVFNRSWSLDYRTGSSLTGGTRDNDLVVAGCDANADGSWDVTTTTIHSGPGADLVFVRDLDRAAVDLGNGASGRTDTVDPLDGDDRIVLRGNTHDFRVFGGNGNDVMYWFVDENVQVTAWLGPSFFGSGGAAPATWDDAGVDRLVLAVPAGTPVNPVMPPPPGAVGFRLSDGSLTLDPPTQGDPFAAYCGECGTSPAGRKTMILEYVSADGGVRTGTFTLTGIEELQVGIGPGAQLYRIDDVNGRMDLVAAPSLCTPPAFPAERCR